MRTFEQRKAEILLCSEKKIRARRRFRRQLLLGCVLLCVCLPGTLFVMHSALQNGEATPPIVGETGTASELAEQSAEQNIEQSTEQSFEQSAEQSTVSVYDENAGCDGNEVISSEDGMTPDASEEEQDQWEESASAEDFVWNYELETEGNLPDSLAIGTFSYKACVEEERIYQNACMNSVIEGVYDTCASASDEVVPALNPSRAVGIACERLSVMGITEGTLSVFYDSDTAFWMVECVADSTVSRVYLHSSGVILSFTQE